MQVEENPIQTAHVTYVTFDTTATPRGRISIATQSEPQNICGVARRIGYTGSSPNALALYRLKLYTTRPTIMETLSGYFVLVHGTFREYAPSEPPKDV